MEIKVFRGFIDTKAIQGSTVTGFCSVMGNIDDGRDRIWPGAYTKTISENRSRIKYLWMHDSMQPPTATIDDIAEVGRNECPPEMLAQFPQTAGALKVVRTYLDTERGTEIFKGIKAGAITESSVGYDPIKFDFEDIANVGMVRNLREMRLWDASDVNWGMQEATMNLKALLSGMPEGVRVDYIVNLAAELKTGRVLSSANWSRIKSAIDTLQELLALAEPPDGEKSRALTERIARRMAIAERELAFIR